MKELKQFTVSETTNRLVNILVAFDELNNELVKCVVDIYGSHQIDERMKKYYNNFGDTSNQILEYIKESVDNSLITSDRTEI